MLRVLVTGGTGFVGTWMQKTQPNGINAVYLNRRDYKKNDWQYWSFYDHIVHLANVSPSKALVASYLHKGRLLFCSSGAIYNQDSEYAENKRAWERKCLVSYDNVVIARLFTFFGNMTQPDKAITQFFECARQGKPIKVTGECIRSYMHGAEMGRQMWKILFEGESGRAYDVGSKRPVSILRLAKRISAFTGCGVEYDGGVGKMPYYVPRGDNGIMD